MNADGLFYILYQYSLAISRIQQITGEQNIFTLKKSGERNIFA